MYGLNYPMSVRATNTSASTQLNYPQRVNNEFTRIVDDIVEQNPRELRATLVHAGYAGIDDADALHQAAIDFANKNAVCLAKIFSLHPLHDVFVEADSILTPRANNGSVATASTPIFVPTAMPSEQIVRIERIKEQYRPKTQAPKYQMAQIPAHYVCCGLLLLLITVLIIKKN